MSSPMKHKRASPIKEGPTNTPVSIGSTSKRSVSEREDEHEPTPSKRQRRIDTESAFITSSPRRYEPIKATPKRRHSRNINEELNSISPKEEESVIDQEEAVVPLEEALSSESPLESSIAKTKSLFNTMFSPLFKQVNSYFGKTEVETVTTTQTEIMRDGNVEVETITTKTKETFEEGSDSDEDDDVVGESSSSEEEDDSVVDTDDETHLVRNVSRELSSDEVLSEVSNTVEDGDVDEDSDDEEEDYDEFDPYLFIANLPALQAHHLNRPVALPPKSAEHHSKITLVLDLDETLVHCSTDPISSAELIFPVLFNEQEYQVYVRKRPGFHQFLKAVSKKFEVVIFTASQEVYASKLLNLIDPKSEYIHHRLYRDSCINVEGNFLKDLTILGRDLSRVIIVDNSPQTFGYQLDNGIPIESWFDDNEDQELVKLIPFLDSIADSNDVRPHILDKYKLHLKVGSYKKTRQEIYE